MLSFISIMLSVVTIVMDHEMIDLTPVNGNRWIYASANIGK